MNFMKKKTLLLMIINLKNGKLRFNSESYKTKNFSEEVVDAKTGKVVIKLGEKINFLKAKKFFDDGLKEILCYQANLYLENFCTKILKLVKMNIKYWYRVK